jgi:hypothetical protein
MLFALKVARPSVTRYKRHPYRSLILRSIRASACSLLNANARGDECICVCTQEQSLYRSEPDGCKKTASRTARSRNCVMHTQPVTSAGATPAASDKRHQQTCAFIYLTAASEIQIT